MNRLLLFFAILSQATLGFAQSGDLFISQFTPTFNHEEQVYFDVQFTSTDELIAANRSGIVKFDGREWNIIRTPSSALSIAIDSALTLYVGCVDDFGQIGISDGQYRFVSLAPEENRALTLQTIVHQNKAYFLQSYALQVFDIQNQVLKTYYTDSTESAFIRITAIDDKVWAETAKNSYFLGDSLQKSKRILPDESIILVSSADPESGKMIMAGSKGNVYLRSSGKYQSVKALTGLSITDLAWVSENVVAASTLSDGIFFYDVVKGVVIEKANNSNGLADNEIFAIASDNANGLWVANSFGFTRLAPLLPIRSFNHYPGLDGNLTTAAFLNNKWHIATSNGIYYFDQINNYKNVVYYVPRRQQKPTPPKAPVPAPPAKTNTSKFQVSSIFKNKNEQEEKKTTTSNTATLKPSQNFKPTNASKKEASESKFTVASVFRKEEKKEGGFISKIIHPTNEKNFLAYERKTRQELVSTRYLYRKVDGLNEKTKQIFQFNQSIIAVTPSGILEVDGKLATEIYEEPVRYVFHPKNSKTLWVSSQTGRIIRLEEVRGVWAETQTLETPGDIILSIYQDSNKTLWMAGANKLFEVIYENGIAKVVDSYPIENQFFDNIRITELKNTLYLFNTLGIFALDTASGLIIADDTLMSQIGKPQRHLMQSDGRPWIHNGNNWIRIEKDGKISKFNYLKLFPEMTFIEQVKDELWLIDNHKALYKFTPSKSDSIPATRMFFRKIQDRGGLIAKTGGIFKVDFERNSVFVEMSRPDYLGLLNVEYQYRLIGLQEEWSAWTRNNLLDFNYLPAGNYTLEVKSRDAFGREQLSEPVSFRIVPPYWQTAWFNALQVLFFAGLVVYASRLNRKQNDDPRLTLLTNVLTIVTIVMIIELLQNLAQSYFGELDSPILAFMLDVFVALLIFPIEQILKRIVTGGKEKALQTD